MTAPAPRRRLSGFITAAQIALGLLAGATAAVGVAVLFAPGPPRPPDALLAERSVVSPEAEVSAKPTESPVAEVMKGPVEPPAPASAPDVGPAVPVPEVAPAATVDTPPPPIARTEAPPVPTTPTVEWNLVSCPAPVARLGRVECGRLKVPADWSTPETGPAIDMFVAVLRALGPETDPDPVLALSGGPGQAGSDSPAFFAERLAPVRARRDIILVDQRGAGLSNPSLRCPKIDPVRYWFGGVTRDDVLGCLGPVKDAGYRLEIFDTPSFVRDLVALRGALGVARWNIVATSYGAIPAAILTREDGAAIRSMVLNSPTDATSTWLDLDRLTEIKRVYKTLEEDCATQPACARAHPGLADIIPRLAAATTARPLRARLRDTADGRDIDGRFAWASISNALTLRLGVGDGASTMPAVLERIDRSAASRGTDADQSVATALAPDVLWRAFRELAYGLNLVIGCRENRPRIDAAAARRAAAGLAPQVVATAVETDYDAACPVLGLAVAAPDLYIPATGSMPTLILTGRYDTLVPTARADSIARGLSSARVVRFRGLGHDVLGASVCAARVAARFIESGGSAPMEDCAERLLPPRFEAPPR